MKDVALVNLLIEQIMDCDVSEIETKRATYLAEEIFLSHYRRSGALELGVITLLNHYADIYLKDDPLRADKLAALQELIDTIQHPSGGQAHPMFPSTVSWKKAQYDPKWRSVQDIPIDQHQVIQYEHVLFLPSHAHLCVIGDSHGDKASLQNIVDNLLQFRQRKRQEQPFLVFLGDYVNNGLNSLGTLQYVLDLQAEYPQKVILLNGNHEFKETYLTAFKEFFITHWNNYVNNPYKLAPPQHYGHIRFDLAQEFGVEQGEEIYDDFVRWGLSLPYICFDQEKKLMVSHSLGRAKSHQGILTLSELVTGKEKEAENFIKLGYAAWKKAQETPHSALVNNRNMTPQLLAEFQRLGIEWFFLGHTHYLSGTIHNPLVYICSSHKDSCDAGHYIFQEMVIECQKRNKPQASACYACWDSNGQKPQLHTFKI